MENSIVITVGDMNGIGPELILKCLKAAEISETRFILVGPVSVFRFYANLIESPLDISVVYATGNIPKSGNVPNITVIQVKLARLPVKLL